MSEYIQSNKENISYITAEKVTCDGSKTSKHPLVYLTVQGGVENQVVCPYCSHTFKKEEKV